ncbi:S1 RNA-binding domain-containing protein [Thermosipho ferrireducens]|uniref:S1 RNA-binding domain-containing protein n=1 Tax=Thermosipho ferrireducens TaxID=2571116 RepID=A0ABX7S6X6_9BACT|nr:S1 RNA-binding domain-containing protein [Thermosipho ferrireducens]QTA37658.1 S1 RNA-binding domain-containing protein [Thermosipho ferrireducens]
MDNSFEKLLGEYLFDEVKRGSLVEGVVVRISESEVFIDFGWKGEGLVPAEELVRSPKDYGIGEKLTLMVLKTNDEEGTALLSEKKPLLSKLRNEIKEKYEKGEKIKGVVKQQIKGGYLVLIENVLPAFLPGSESLIKQGENIPDGFLEFKIIKFESRGRKQNIVLSRKAIKDEFVKRFFSERKPGDVIEGIVENIEKFGAFVRIVDGIVGLLPNSEVSYDNSITAEDVTEIGKSVKLLIKEIDRNNKKVTLSLKALMPDPWLNVEKKYPVGTVVSGTVKSILPYGFFVTLEPGVDGLVHISEIFWGKPGKINDVVSEGDVVKVVVKEVDKEKRKLSLSYKMAKGDPWEEVEEKYPVGNLVTGVVGTILTSGVIIDLEEGISGYCPISELSWRYIEKPEEIVRIGEKVKAVIIDLDKEARRIRLSVRKSTENPWEKFSRKYKNGDVITGKVLKEVKKGYIILVEDIEVYLPKSHTISVKNVGDSVTGKIIRFVQDGEIYRITISEKELVEKEKLKELQEETEKERTLSLERKISDANSINSGKE